tara:strand:+ start:237 stop:908 length:672 start_codon:yes stop_codon:yes gene_type:complete
MKTENWIHGWLKSIWKKAVWENPTIKKKEEWKGPGNPLSDGTYSEAEAADYYIGNKKESNMSSEVLTEFDDIIEVVLEHEGGYVNDPKDPGGETKYGVSKRAYPDVDIKGLTIEGAKEIYKRDYWDKNKVDTVPSKLKHIYFDMAVNMGKGRAVRILQEAANGKNKNKIDVDGGLGPATRRALEGVELERVRAYRVKYYANLVKRKPDLGKFYFGWFRRSLEV